MKRKFILAGILLFQTGCAHNAYKPQRVEVSRHTLVLHETKVDMENAYVEWWSRKDNWRDMKPRGSYTGWFDPIKNDLHCFGPYPEGCMIHEYKHLAEKYGLVIPNDPHFGRKPTEAITKFTLTGHGR